MGKTAVTTTGLEPPLPFRFGKTGPERPEMQRAEVIAWWDQLPLQFGLRGSRLSRAVVIEQKLE
jgi:hypothetical protein